MSPEEQKAKMAEQQKKMVCCFSLSSGSFVYVWLSQKEDLQKEIEILTAKGEWFAPVKAMKNIMARQQEEQKKLRESNPTFANPFTAHAAAMSANSMDGPCHCNYYLFEISPVP